VLPVPVGKFCGRAEKLNAMHEAEELKVTTSDHNDDECYQSVCNMYQVHKTLQGMIIKDWAYLFPMWPCLKPVLVMKGICRSRLKFWVVVKL
jgi:hypothetical protein